jgi:hypothetical protein
MLDGGAPHGRHYYWKSHRLPSLPDATLDEFAALIASAKAPFWQLNGWAVGGAATRVPADATAMGQRGQGFHVNIVSAWPPVDGAGESYVSWVRDGWAALQPYSEGVYANFLSDEGSAGISTAYGDRLTRLTALKDRYDRNNFFRMNANIPPSRS